MTAESVRNEFDPVANFVGSRRLCDAGVFAGNVAHDDGNHLIFAPAADEVAAFASDLPDHQDSSQLLPMSNSTSPGRQC